MRCRKARRLLGEYVDGELPQRQMETVGKHVADCGRCSEREQAIRRLVVELGSLPRIALSPLQEARLKRAIQSRLIYASAETRPRFVNLLGHRTSIRSPLVAAALVALLLGAAGLAYGLVSIRGPVAEREGGRAAVTVEVPEAERGARFVRSLLEPTGEEMGLPVEPALDLSRRQLHRTDIPAFAQDVPARLQFYSAYWYPLASWERGSEAFNALRDMVLSSLMERTAGMEDSKGLRTLLDGLIARLEGLRALPCYVAYVLWEGKRPAWLVSLSTSSDALLLDDALLGLDAATMSLGTVTGKTLANVADQEYVVFFLYHLFSPDQEGAALRLRRGRDTASTPAAGEDEGSMVSASEPGGIPPVGPDANKEMIEFLEKRIRDISTTWGGEVLLNAWQNGDYGAVLRMISSDWRGFWEVALKDRRICLVPRWIWVADASTGEVLYKDDAGP